MKKTPFLFSVLSVSLLAAGCGLMPGTTSSSATESSSRTAGRVVDDGVITSKVKSAFLADPDISGLKINVDTVKGVVRLKGEIKTMALRKKAEAIARDVQGVEAVDNQLIITG